MEVVWFYHVNIADADKILISDTFHHADSLIQILVATDAVGLGIDLPDVERVVQYGLPKEPDMAGLWQRFGRAARGLGVLGEAVLIVDHWVIRPQKEYADGKRVQELETEDTLTERELEPEEPGGGRPKKRRSEVDKQTDLPLVLWSLFNEAPCYRAHILDHFQNHLAINDVEIRDS